MHLVYGSVIGFVYLATYRSYQVFSCNILGQSTRPLISQTAFMRFRLYAMGQLTLDMEFQTKVIGLDSWCCITRQILNTLTEIVGKVARKKIYYACVSIHLIS